MSANAHSMGGPSATAIRIADHLRPVLFECVFGKGMSVGKATDFLFTERRVRIPVEVAEALVREEAARRRYAAEARVSARIVDAVKGVTPVKREEFSLPPSGAHVPRVAFVKGHAHVTCVCGEKVCALPRADREPIERAWYEHRDGQAAWKKA